MGARREAALRLPPLRNGVRDPDFDLPHLNSGRVCHICGGGRPGELFRVFGQVMCRDRIECYQRFKKGPKR